MSAISAIFEFNENFDAALYPQLVSDSVLAGKVQVICNAAINRSIHAKRFVTQVVHQGLVYQVVVNCMH